VSGAANRPLRVLVVNLGRFGGVTEYGWFMGRALAGRCEVAVVYSSAAENRHKWLDLDVPRLQVDTFSSVPGMLASLFAVGRFARISRFASKFDPDVVYYPGGHAFKLVLDWILPRRARIVLTVHDPLLHHGEDTWSHRLLDASNRLKVDGYVLLNETQRDEFISHRRLDPKSVRVIPHGVFDDFAEGTRDIAARQGLLFIGRIRPYKGLGVLLAAFQAADIDRRTSLVIAGEGELSAEETVMLGRLQADGRPVKLINRWLTAEEMAALLSEARFAVLPYTSATQSGVIPMASALGVPSIAAATGGITEQIADGRTGLLFPAGDSAALADTLKRALAMDADAYAEMSQACASHAKANWDWGHLADDLLDFFETL